MKNMKQQYLLGIIYIIIGVILIGFSFAGILDEFWNGCGFGIFTIGIIRLLRSHRFNHNEAYREKVETELSDERNHFLRNKAWAWAGYLFVLIAGTAIIVLKIMGQDLLSYAASMAVCLILVLFWGSYQVLKKKY